MKNFFGTLLIALTLLTTGGVLVVPQKVEAQVIPISQDKLVLQDLQRRQESNQRNFNAVYSPEVSEAISTINNQQLQQTLSQNQSIINQRLQTTKNAVSAYESKAATFNAEAKARNDAGDPITREESARMQAELAELQQAYNEAENIYRKTAVTGMDTLVGELTKDPATRQAYQNFQSSAGANSDDPTTPGPICEWWLPLLGCLDHIPKNIFYGILQIFAFILWMAGNFFDTVVDFSIVNISSLLGKCEQGATTCLGPAIETSWVVVRDFANVFFIFILLFAAINFVLGKSSEGKKMVSGVLFIALVINFSLFFTKLIIDISNSFSIATYNKVLVDTKSTSLSEAVMNSLKLQTLFNATNKDNIINNAALAPLSVFNQSIGGAAILMLGGSAFFFITAAVFFVMAFMFLVRVVVLAFLMILAPLAFASSVLPAEHNQFKKWMKSLMSQATFVPIFMLMFYLTLKVTQSLSGNDSIAHALSGGSLGSVLSFFIIIAFMVATMITSSKTAVEAGGLTGKAFGIGDKVRGWTQRYAGGVAGRTLKYTAGDVAARLEERMNKSGTGSSVLGQFTRKYTTGAVANARFGGKSSMKEIRDRTKTQEESAQKERESRAKIGNRKSIFDAGTKAGATPDQIKAMSDEVRGMSTKDLENLDPSILNHSEVVSALSPSQIAHLVSDKNEKLSESNKDKIRGERFKGVKAAIAKFKAGTPITPDEKTLIKGLTIEEIELDPSLLEEEKFIELLTGGQLEAVQKSKAFTSAQKAEVRNKRESDLRTGDLAKVKTKLDQMKSEDIAKLPSDILKRSEVIYNLDSADLAAMEKGIDKGTRQAIATEIRTTMRGTAAFDYIENGPSKHLWA